MVQPAQSPDLNILDLGFFHSLKVNVAQLKHRTDKLPDLLVKIKQAYTNYDKDTLAHIWAHLYDCYREILVANGGNQYIPPHGQNRMYHKTHLSSVNLKIDIEAYNEALNLLD